MNQAYFEDVIISYQNIEQGTGNILFVVGNQASLQYLPADNEQSATALTNNASSMVGVEPRKFSKYNPNMSRRSNQHSYRNHVTDSHRNHERKSGYMQSGQLVSNGFPSKYQYSRNVDGQHFDNRPGITHGTMYIIK